MIEKRKILKSLFGLILYLITFATLNYKDMNYFMYALGIILYSYCSFELGGPNIFVFAKKSTVDEPLEIYRQMIEANCEDYLNGTSRSDFQVRLTNYFRQVDKNNDSFVTVDECKGWENDNGFKLDDNLAEAWLLQYDFDGNGKISVDEFASTKIDANNDSILTMEECIQYDFGKMLNAVNALKNANTTTET